MNDIARQTAHKSDVHQRLPDGTTDSRRLRPLLIQRAVAVASYRSCCSHPLYRSGPKEILVHILFRFSFIGCLDAPPAVCGVDALLRPFPPSLVFCLLPFPSQSISPTQTNVLSDFFLLFAECAEVILQSGRKDAESVAKAVS